MKEIDTLPTARVAPELHEGLLHHASGRLREAAECYGRVYQANPGDADALLLLGIVARQARRFLAAVQLTALAVKQKPQAPHAHLNLALAHLEAGDTDPAAACCRQALALDPLNPRTWSCLGDIEAKRGNDQAARAAYERATELPSENGRATLALGNLLFRQGKYDQALAVYAHGVRRAPANAELHFALGTTNSSLRKTRAAKAAYWKAVELRPNFPEVYLNLGNALYDEGNFSAAVESYRRAIALRPRYVKAHCNLGNALSALGRYAESVACYEDALTLQPDTAAARHNLGNALLQLRDFRGAEACFRRLNEFEPGRAEHHNGLGNSLVQQGRSAEAEECYRKALESDPDFAAAHTNLANVLLTLGRPEEMRHHYRRALELDPKSPGGRYNLALACLREGNFREGWQLHEWRWDFRDLKLRRRKFTQPQWKGQPLTGETILLHAEQGLGDTLQFVRYLPLVTARGGRVILEVQPQLRLLLEEIEGSSQVIARGEPLPDFAYHCPLMSLPLAFDTTIDTIPFTAPYLSIDRAAVAAAWRARPRQGDSLRVGLAWAGNPRFRNDERRSTTLEALLPLTGVWGAAFFSLQFGPAAAQISGMQSRFPLVDACSQNTDFSQTAAFAATLDLIISVDTSVAHLAGAMGLPVWVLLPYLADWRWLERREDSPWYPTARLFRQPAPGDWKSLVEHVRDELDRFAQVARPKKQECT